MYDWRLRRTNCVTVCASKHSISLSRMENYASQDKIKTPHPLLWAYPEWRVLSLHAHLSLNSKVLLKQTPSYSSSSPTYNLYKLLVRCKPACFAIHIPECRSENPAFLFPQYVHIHVRSLTLLILCCRYEPEEC